MSFRDLRHDSNGADVTLKVSLTTRRTQTSGAKWCLRVPKSTR